MTEPKRKKHTLRYQCAIWDLAEKFARKTNAASITAWIESAIIEKARRDLAQLAKDGRKSVSDL